MELFCHSKDGRILGEEIATQTSARYGGVIPSFAMGWHAEALPKITKKVLKEVSIPHVAAISSMLLQSLKVHFNNIDYSGQWRSRHSVGSSERRSGSDSNNHKTWHARLPVHRPPVRPTAQPQKQPANHSYSSHGSSCPDSSDGAQGKRGNV